MISACLIAEIQQKLWNERALSTGEPVTFKYVNFLQSFNRSALSIFWYMAQNVYHNFSMSILFRRSFKNVIFSRLLKVAIATSTLMSEVDNYGFAQTFTVLMQLRRKDLYSVFMYKFRYQEFIINISLLSVLIHCIGKVLIH